MKTLFDPAVRTEMHERVQKLAGTTKPLWGKMNSAQMMAHCTAALEYACGDYEGKQLLIGKLIGSFMKKSYFNEKPFAKNSPTSSQFIVADQRDFEQEKKKLLAVIDRFSNAGPGKITKSPHMFFGRLTDEQWGIGMYKHMDHHLRQFGV